MTNLTLDTDGHIADDLQCARCGYALRGVDPAGACPECGQSVQDTVHVMTSPKRLRWLRRMRLGCLLLLPYCAIGTARHLFELLRWTLGAFNDWWWLAIHAARPFCAVIGFVGILILLGGRPLDRERGWASAMRVVVPLAYGLGIAPTVYYSWSGHLWGWPNGRTILDQWLMSIWVYSGAWLVVFVGCGLFLIGVRSFLPRSTAVRRVLFALIAVPLATGSRHLFWLIEFPAYGAAITVVSLQFAMQLVLLLALIHLFIALRPPTLRS